MTVEQRVVSEHLDRVWPDLKLVVDDEDAPEGYVKFNFAIVYQSAMQVEDTSDFFDDDWQDKLRAEVDRHIATLAEHIVMDAADRVDNIIIDFMGSD